MKQLLLIACCALAACGAEPREQNVVVSQPVSVAPNQPDARGRCVGAMLNVTRRTVDWENDVALSCAPLNSDQLQAVAREATARAGGEITFWDPGAVSGQFEAGRLPYGTRAGSRAEEWLALQGNYQAQRNLAHSLGQDNKIAGCAWRLIIIKSGARQVDGTDVSNVEVACGKLSDIEQEAAAARFTTIRQEIQRVAAGQFPSWLKAQLPSS